MKRAYTCEGWFSRKAWGKTTALAQRIEWESSFASVSSVWVCDPPDSFRHVAPFANWARWTSWRDYNYAVLERGKIPRVNVFALGYDRPEAYEPVLNHAVLVGDGLLVIDEVQLWVPARGRPNKALVRIAAMGRHMPDSQGVERQTSLIVASQTWSGVGLELRNQLNTVVVGKMDGRANKEMLRAEVHEDAPELMDRLKPHQWSVLRPEGGRLPGMASLNTLV